MDNVFDVLRDFLKDRQGIDPAAVTADATLEALNIDSLMLMELFFEFEEKLGLDLNDVKETPTTIGGLVALIERLKSSKS